MCGQVCGQVCGHLSCPLQSGTEQGRESDPDLTCGSGSFRSPLGLLGSRPGTGMFSLEVASSLRSSAHLPTVESHY